jgi:hypothetical protein
MFSFFVNLLSVLMASPLITLITRIMDARNLCAARACGKWARDSG